MFVILDIFQIVHMERNVYIFIHHAGLVMHVHALIVRIHIHYQLLHHHHHQRIIILQALVERHQQIERKIQL
jgi:hypothetical protein